MYDAGATTYFFSYHMELTAGQQVPRDCRGIVLGSTFNDMCGVCGGDNSTCSGCDVEPNSGRTKECRCDVDVIVLNICAATPICLHTDCCIKSRFAWNGQTRCLC